METEDLNTPIAGQFSNSIWYITLAGIAVVLLAFPLYLCNVALANYVLPNPKDAETAKQTLNAIALFMGTGGAGTALSGAWNLMKRSLKLTDFKGQRQAEEHRANVEVSKEVAKKEIEGEKSPATRDELFRPVTGNIDVTDISGPDETVIADFADAPGGNAGGDL